MDAPVQQQPLVKAAQAAQFARRRTLIDAVAAQMLQKSRHILLRRRQQNAVASLDELGKGLQIAVIGLARQRPQPLFHAQIGLIVLQQREIARVFHTSIIRAFDCLCRRCSRRRTSFIMDSTSATAALRSKIVRAWLRLVGLVVRPRPDRV